GGENEEEDGGNNSSANTSRLNNCRRLIALGSGGIGLDEVIKSLNEGIDINKLNDDGFLAEQGEGVGNDQTYYIQYLTQMKISPSASHSTHHLSILRSQTSLINSPTLAHIKLKMTNRSNMFLSFLVISN
ncbi:hypothetical protein PSTT_04077, partial [Puccinia striiformis]